VYVSQRFMSCQMDDDRGGGAQLPVASLDVADWRSSES
jgi:hypothetical protein